MNPLKIAGLVMFCSSVVFSQSQDPHAPKVTLHGYAEVHSNNTINGTRQLDPHRAVIGLHARLSPKINFSMELDFEHSFTEPEFEFAILDFQVMPELTIRTGALLMPMGPLNENHEPPLFHSVERPMLQKDIIPTTWQEVGAGVITSLFDYRLKMRGFIVNGLNGLKQVGEASDGTPVYAVSKGIRSMRTKAVEPSTEDIAGIGRLEYSLIPELAIGVSGFYGGADQSTIDSLQLWTSLYEGDLRARIKSLELQFQAAYGSIYGEFFSNSANKDGRVFWGTLAEVAYHFNGLLGENSDLVPFARYEWIENNQGSTVADAYNLLTMGVAYYPVREVAIKADYNFFAHKKENAYSFKDGTKGSNKHVVNLGVGLMY